MAIVTLRLPNVKSINPARPNGCPHCKHLMLQRWGGQQRWVKDPHLERVWV